jgi:hypothetical protein
MDTYCTVLIQMWGRDGEMAGWDEPVVRYVGLSWDFVG